MKLKKAISFLMAATMLLTSFSISSSAAGEVIATNSQNKALCEKYTQIPGDKVIDVLFIGNEYTSTGDTPYYFKRIVAGRRKIDVKQITKDGYSLEQHANELDKSENAEIIKKTNVLILQEKDAKSLKTVEAINKIKSKFSKDVKVYFTVTEFGQDNNIVEATKSVSGLNYLFPGESIKRIIKKGHSTSLFIDSSNKQTHLYGYINGLTTAGQLFEFNLIDTGYKFVAKKDLDMIPGKTDGTIESIIKEFKMIVKDVVFEKSNAVDEYIDICLIGNSQLFASQAPQKLQALANNANKKIRVYEITRPGEFIDQLKFQLSRQKFDDVLKKSDYLFIQGVLNGDDQNREDVQYVMNYFRSDVKGFGLGNFGDENVNFPKGPLTPIDWWYVKRKLNDGVNYNWSDFVLSDGYHDNAFSALITAAVCYTTVTKESCEGIDLNFLREDEWKVIHGNTKAEKTKEINRIFKLIADRFIVK